MRRLMMKKVESIFHYFQAHKLKIKQNEKILLTAGIGKHC